MSLVGATDSELRVRWSTSQVLDWMTNFTDSKEGIKLKIMNIVQENDLDGHALKQLRDDPEELHDLLPVLKERLTFKAMMKGLFGPGVPQRHNFPGSGRPHPSSRASADRQSPLQLPSTSFESPLVPRQTPPLANASRGSPGLPPYSAVVSTGQEVLSSSQSADPGPSESGSYQVYPTGIVSDASGSHFLPSSSSVYDNRVLGPSTSANPQVTISGVTSRYRNEPKTDPAVVSAIQELHDPPYVPSRKSSTSSCRKVLEINRKYRKILQKVRSTPPGSDSYQGMQIPFPAPLPNFSPILRQQIEKGNLLSFKTRFVYECAQFYMSINPTPTHTAYRNISMTIVQNYPELADRSKHRESWKSFNTSLSQAIRNIRRRLRSVPGTGFPPASQRYQQKHLRGRPRPDAMADIDIGDEGADGGNSATNDDAGQRSPGEIVESPEVDDDDEDLLECLAMPGDDVKITIGDDSDTEMKEIVIKAEKGEEGPDGEESVQPGADG